MLSDEKSEEKTYEKWYNLLVRWLQHQFNPSLIWLNFRFNWFECEPNGTGALWPFYYDEKIFSEINLQSIYFPFISYFLWQQNCGECRTRWKLSLWLPHLNDLRKQDWELSGDYIKVLLKLVRNLFQKIWIWFWTQIFIFNLFLRHKCMTNVSNKNWNI